MNTLYIANAGCGKTTKMVKKTLEDNRKSLVLTLSNNEFEEIIHKYKKYNKAIPENIVIDKFDNIDNYNINDFEVLYIDEFQEIKDSKSINKIFGKIEINLYFDYRQRTINNKLEFNNKLYDFNDYINLIKIKYNFEIVALNISHRMTQKICDLVGKIYDEVIESDQVDNDHSGIFFVTDVDDYIKKYKPYILEADKEKYANTKGLTVDHILIYPTIDMVNFLKGNKDYDKISVYISLTRAKYSIGFVMAEIMKYM